MSPLAEILLHTVQWSAAATALVLAVGVPLAYLLARAHFPGKEVLAALVSLPLVLPPTAVGYLLLRLFADDGPLGRDILGLDIVLTWRGVVLACAVMALPLVVRLARVSFEEVNPRLEGVARTLGYGPLRTFLMVSLPLAGRGLVAAALLGFTRAMGEFGATVVLAGNIPGRTQTLASALYSAQQAGMEARANVLLLAALGVGFAAILTTEWLVRRPQGERRRR